MKRPQITSVILILFYLSLLSYAGSVDEYIQKADSLKKAGDLAQAAELMTEAVDLYPDSALACSYLGLYRGTQAGKTKNYVKAGRFVDISFKMLDKAVEIEPNNPIVRFNRAVISVKVPSFLGKMDTGIQDFECLLKMHSVAPTEKTAGLISPTYNFLAETYLKQGENQKAVAAWQKVVELAPGSPLAEGAQKQLARLTKTKREKGSVERKIFSPDDVDKLKTAVQENPENALLYIQLGQAYVDIEDYAKADVILRQSIEKDSTNVEAFLLLIQVVGELADVGYDEKIYEDTNYRTNLAFEIVRLTEKAVELAPENMELLLRRGVIGIMMPFFVGKLDDAIKDLETVRQSYASDEIIAEAIFWLGYAYQKKATTLWIDVVKNYSETKATRMAFQTMCPSVQYFDPAKYKKPVLAIDFLLGFRDELAPQTVVWIETKDGDFVKTIYVSGFSGYVKEKQINLPKWSKSSRFMDVDGITGASIDLGQHIYVWDLKDKEGMKIPAGNYVVGVEVSYWPSMEYQIVTAPIKIGRKSSKMVVEEGDLIPYLEVNYLSGKK